MFPIFIFLISYFDIKQKRIPIAEDFEGRDSGANITLMENPVSDKEEPVKYARSAITPEMVALLTDKLTHLVDNEKVFLKNDLTLRELSEQMQASTHHVSQLLNEKMNQNFYELINYHRVQEVMRRLSSDKYKNLKILAIAFDSGFNSKTTFNTAFKKYSGSSPTEFRTNKISSKNG